MLKVSFQPDFVIDNSEIIDGPQAKKEDNEDEFLENIGNFKSQIGDLISNNRDLSVIPLGTGSSAPGKYRNVSSTLIELPSSNILLDCGEGTLGQLFRVFGPRLEEVLMKIRLIFISHLHADHHLGMPIFP